MDSLINAAARALALGDPLGALKRVALRDDAPALALRGIAMAQLGDFERAKVLVRRAERTFGAKEAIARARCVIAEAEIALASRDLGWPEKRLEAARATLEAHGDRINAAHARYLAIRLLLLIGRLDDAERALADSNPASLPPALRAIHELSVAGIAMRRIHVGKARAALARAETAAHQAGIPALMAEVEALAHALDAPAARRMASEGSQLLTLEQVEALLASKLLVVDACRYVVRDPRSNVSLASRPVLFALSRTLAEAWPNDAPRSDLIAIAFRTRYADETHRARLRVEIGRLRRALRAMADIRATARGFELVPHASREVVVLARPVEEKHAAVLATLSDGEAWSSSALAMALGVSQRMVQRALDALAESGKVRALGRGRARRWLVSPLPGFTTALLLPAPLPGD
ncbi:MAG TPA: helix-turn-helix domain-containing protein [Rhodanobacteraceae bacterium]|nr:helix-turn-helix domain-containing protein [Rhodanobacteraceae bacterium]